MSSKWQLPIGRFDNMKRTKKITETLKAIAKTLPRQEYHYYDHLVESGDDLIKRGETHDGDHLPILPHKQYVKKVPIKNEVNHGNRLKSAYDSGGKEAVKKYLVPFLKPEKKDEFMARVDQALK